jgi:hypothetical protein
MQGKRHGAPLGCPGEAIMPAELFPATVATCAVEL